MRARIQGEWIRDEAGRRLLLRGVNLGGSTKVPYPDGATWRRDSLNNPGEASFVGRPFPLAEADEHFRRLKAWGLTFLRFLVTWEAVEHAGPGLYDEDYLDYLHAVVRKAGQHGFLLFIDPHEDVWSRFTGGDGAPAWTLEAAGFDLGNLHRSGAAFTHQGCGDPLPRMIWPTNNYKLAAATMWTLFFAGDVFAPELRVANISIQSFLQSHFIKAIRQIAARLREFDHVIGYDTLNEPAPGFIGLTDLTAIPGRVHIGVQPTPFQSMLAGEGIPQQVERWEMRPTGAKRLGTTLLNPDGVRAWQAGRECVWRQAGVWDIVDGQPRLLRPDHFASVDGRPVNINQDFLRPFANRFADAIRAEHPGAMIFLETIHGNEAVEWGPDDARDVIFAPHWYDGFVLGLKEYSSWLGADAHRARLVVGPGAVRRSFHDQIEHYRRLARSGFGQVPLLIGETGISFDLKEKHAYRTGDFRLPEAAMDRTLRAMDDALVGYTLWNYTADNTNARGDQWNDEDLSIFSRDQQSDPSDIHSGGRALRAVVRPYPRATSGDPLQLSFDRKTRVFIFEFRHDPAVDAPTEIFLPSYQYPDGFSVKISDGKWAHDPEDQLLRYLHSPDRDVHRIEVRPR